MTSVNCLRVGTWIERGRGTLRLNDKQLDNHALQSRLVMRTQGCLRVILNTKVGSSVFIFFPIDVVMDCLFNYRYGQK